MEASSSLANTFSFESSCIPLVSFPYEKREDHPGEVSWEIGYLHRTELASVHLTQVPYAEKEHASPSESKKSNERLPSRVPKENGGLLSLLQSS